jgi:formylglycine-generating enzyme required for sulfatase activity
MREAIVGPASAKGFAFEAGSIEALVEDAGHEGGLPLLQFALAELWEARDEANRTLPAAALAALGGVGGALARHADGVVAALLPAQRAAARRILLSLVTAEGTRARRSGDQLCGAPGADPPARAALEALVRGRLVVARGGADGEGGAYEVAHEALLSRWGQLNAWRGDDAELRAARGRLEAAVEEWQRQGHAASALWSPRQLAEADRLDAADLGPGALDFLARSRRAARARRARRLAIIFGAPIAIACVVGGVRLEARLAQGRVVDRHVVRVRALHARVEAALAASADHARRAFAHFDAGERQAGEAVWQEARNARQSAAVLFTQAEDALDAALERDPGRADVRALLGDVLYARIVDADAAGERERSEELAARMARYDDDGSRRARLVEAGLLDVTTDPPGARLTLIPYTRETDGRRPEGPPVDLGTSPLAAAPLDPGSYLLVATAPGRPPVRAPFVIARGERLPLALPLPRAVPAGFIYVPPGRFLFGARGDDDLRRDFYNTVPLHPVTTGGYLIARHETTFAEWIAFLDALPAAERARRTPRGTYFDGKGGELRWTSGRWELTHQTPEGRRTAPPGQPWRYEGRQRRASQDWLRFPVFGIDLEDVTAYGRWLAATGRAPGARPCTEHEWERGARGADDRQYPHGDRLDPDDANFDLTYGRVLEAFGPDEVGSHPASRSPFGLDDTAGNHYEWTLSSLVAGEAALRSASYFYAVNIVRVFNREPVSPKTRTQMIGARMCADAPAP